MSEPAILSIATDDQLNEATGFGLFLPKAVIKPTELLAFLLPERFLYQVSGD